jgi:hypothetical protein
MDYGGKYTDYQPAEDLDNNEQDDWTDIQSTEWWNDPLNGSQQWVNKSVDK